MHLTPKTAKKPQIAQIKADFWPAAAGRTASVENADVPQIVADFGVLAHAEWGVWRLGLPSGVSHPFADP